MAENLKRNQCHGHNCFNYSKHGFVYCEGCLNDSY